MTKADMHTIILKHLSKAATELSDIEDRIDAAFTAWFQAQVEVPEPPADDAAAAGGGGGEAPAPAPGG